MPRPTDPNRYPLAFGQALAHTVATAPKPFVIPVTSPEEAAALRSQFYGYFRALRATNDSAVADAIAIYIRRNPDRLEFVTRDATPQALTIEAALRASQTAQRADPRDPAPFDLESSEQPNLPSV